MQRWVSDPRGANAPPRTMPFEEYDMPSDTSKETTTSINTALEDDAYALIHCDQYDDWGIMARGNFRGCYVGINYCPFCGEGLGTNAKLEGVLIHEFDERYISFDERPMTMEQVLRDYGIPFVAEQAGIEDEFTEDMSDIEVVIRVQGKYRGPSRYADYPGPLELDFDKAWSPKELAGIAQYCAEHGRANPAVALWKLLCMAEGPAVWALALLDLEAKDIPGLLHIDFDRRADNEPIVVIEAGSLRHKRELNKIGDELLRINANIKGYDTTAGEKVSDMGYSEDAKRFAKLAKHVGFLAEESDLEEGVLHYRLAPYYREDVDRFLQERDKSGVPRTTR
jgi:hypothetical protein